MQNSSQSRLHYYVICIGEFAKRKEISQKEAFNYLYAHKGIDFLIDCYDAEHTLSLNDAVEDLSAVCKRNGGIIE